MSGESILDRHRREQRERAPGTTPGANTRDARGNAHGNAGGDADDGGLSVSEAFVSMLDFVLATGRRVALPYATLLKAECDGSASITLTYSTDKVVINGRRLDTLYRAIVQHRAREVKMSINADKSAPFEQGDGGDGVVVASVTITPQE